MNPTKDNNAANMNNCEKGNRCRRVAGQRRSSTIKSTQTKSNQTSLLSTTTSLLMVAFMDNQSTNCNHGDDLLLNSSVNSQSSKLTGDITPNDIQKGCISLTKIPEDATDALKYDDYWWRSFFRFFQKRSASMDRNFLRDLIRSLRKMNPSEDSAQLVVVVVYWRCVSQRMRLVQGTQPRYRCISLRRGGRPGRGWACLVV